MTHLASLWLLLQLLVFRTKEFFATYSHVIVDEAHERDVDLDLLLLLLRRAMKKQAAAIEAEAAAPPAAAPAAADMAKAAGPATPLRWASTIAGLCKRTLLREVVLPALATNRSLQRILSEYVECLGAL